MADKFEVDLSLFTDMPDEDLEDIMATIKNGADRPAEFFGFDDGALNAIENIALGFYRARLWDRASLIYGFALRLDPSRSSCWRGLGACAQANKEYPIAKTCYEKALEQHPADVITKVFLGECLCLGGDIERGLKVLNEAIEQNSDEPKAKAYVTRARAIVSAGGGRPAPLILKKKGVPIAEDAAKVLAEAGIELDPSRELHIEDIQNDPILAEGLGELAIAFNSGRITLAEVGGFAANELDGAYACACKYAEMNQLADAMRICSYLIFIDPYKGRYYQLVGICLQRLKLFGEAEHFYMLSLTLEPDDPRSLVYRGEAQILMGDIDKGLATVHKGVDLADAVVQGDIVERGKVLIKQFGV